MSRSDPPPREDRRRLGVWIVGARGAISTCVAYGLAGLRHGWIEPLGLATERDPLARLDLRSPAELVLGGHEVARGTLSDGARALVRHRVLPSELVASATAEAAAFDARIRPGMLDGPDVGLANLDPASAALGSAPARERIERVRADLRDFREEHDLERVVVVNLATTEVWREEPPEWATLARLEEALDDEPDLPASSVYAYAAFREQAPYVNFTPNRGASIPALRELALELGVPHCGNDGKTGETLIKTALAPVFAARALRVLSWQGYNLLGNKDGESLADPMRSHAKRRNKDDVLREILGDPGLHSKVGIDFVPSLHDWKTAWDHIHFEGFLGAKMTLQFTWTGSDSALAAPLVLDLVRLADFAARAGERGEMRHTASYFKAPIAGGTHDFHRQFRLLIDYAEQHLGA